MCLQLKGCQVRFSCHGNCSRSPLPHRHKKHRNKGYFDQKYVILIPNVTQFVQKAFIDTNKVQNRQLLDGWKAASNYYSKGIFVNTKKVDGTKVQFSYVYSCDRGINILG